MREHKYRVWNKKEKKYIYDWQDTIYVEQFGFDPSHTGFFESPEQYTEFKDETEKEIYEMDIADVGSNPYFGLYIVKYGEYKLKDQTNHDRQKYHFGFYLESLDGFNILSLIDVIKGDELQPSYGRSKSYAKIIGNVFENPELLNQ